MFGAWIAPVTRVDVARTRGAEHARGLAAEFLKTSDSVRFSCKEVFFMKAQLGNLLDGAAAEASAIRPAPTGPRFRLGLALLSVVMGCRRRRPRVLPLHGGLHGHDGDDPHRSNGRALEVEVVRDLGTVLRGGLLPALRRLDLGGWLAGQGRRLYEPGSRLCRFRRLWRGACRRRCGRPAARAPHSHGDARHVHPAVRMVRFQRSIDLRGNRHPVCDGGGQYGHCRGFWRRPRCSGSCGGRASPTPG